MWCVIKNMYEASRNAIFLEAEKSTTYRLEQDVAQGCSLSPIYCQYLKDVKEAGLEIGISSGGMLSADDYVGVSESRESLQKLM